MYILKSVLNCYEKIYMSSKVNNALYDLIHSLSKSEKRYFKLYSSRHTIGDENNYIRLFDYIEQQEEYDEDLLFADFKGEAFLNRFSITKKRLYDHILNALDAFHANNSVEVQVYRQLHSADILYEKALYNQCRRTLSSAEKLASKHGFNELMILIQSKKKKLLETLGPSELSDNEVVEISETINLMLKELDLNDQLWVSKSQLFMKLSEKGVARSMEEKKEFEAIINSLPAITDDTDNATKFLFNHTMSAYHFAIGDLKSSFGWLEQNVHLLEDTEFAKQIPINKQISLLTNAIYIVDKLGDFKRSIEFLGMLKRLSQVTDLNEDLEIKLFSSISSIELSLNIRKGDFESAHHLINDIVLGFERFDDKLTVNRRAFLAFKLAVVQLGVGDYNQALKWINLILNDSKLDKTEDIYGFTLLLDLLVHIELHHNELLPYSLKSVQRFFKTRNRMYSFETVLLKFISKLIKSKDRFEAEEIWEELHKALGQVTDESAFESVALDYFDFRAWAESKLKRKPFSSIVKENYQVGMRSAS